jgi:subtilisin family serine protease
MTPPPSSHRCATRLSLEPLEDRTVLSTTSVSTALGTINYDPESVSNSSILVDFTNTTANYTGYSALAGTTVQAKLNLLPGYYLVHVSPGVSVSDALTAYAGSGLISVVSPDYLLSIQSTPNDPLYSQQWALPSTSPFGINASTAWDVTTGLPRTVVAEMDTGIDYNHPDLYQNIWINPAEIPASRLKNLKDVDGDGIITMRDLNNPVNQGPGKIMDQNGDGIITAADLLAPMKVDANHNDTGLGGWATGKVDPTTGYVDDIVGWNFVTNTNNPMDDNGHGTHVAGIIGAQGNNGIGVTGVDPNALLMPVKFLDANGSGSIGLYIVALDYAVAAGAKISSNSWAGGDFTSLLYDAINNARSHGVIYVAAAGNGATNIDTNPVYPASYNLDNVVVVASTSKSGALSSFSNYGIGTVDVAAPGEAILSTLPNNKYGQLSGTSMAAPEASGVLALIWSEHPTWTYSQVINQLLSTVQKDSQLTGKVTTGGIIDAGAAVGATPANPAAPTVLSTQTSGPDRYTLNLITVNFSQPIDPATMTASAIQLIGPSGQPIALTSIRAVGGSNNTKWNLQFLTQNTPGTYSLQLASTIKNTQGVALPNYFTTYTISKTAAYANNTAMPIPDVGTVTSPINVTLNDNVQTIALKVNITHTFDADLSLSLVAPNGQTVQLAYRLGGSGDNYTNTVFADSGNKLISAASPPFTGTFKPIQALSSLAGVPALGTWKLVVQDLATGDVGTLVNWSITITTTNGMTLSTSSTSSKTQEVAQPGPAVLTTTVSAPALVGTQLVSPLESPGSATGSTEATVQPGWLVRALQGEQSPTWMQSPPVPAAGEATQVSDAFFQQSLAEASASPTILRSTPGEKEAPGAETAMEESPEGTTFEIV